MMDFPDEPMGDEGMPQGEPSSEMGGEPGMEDAPWNEDEPFDAGVEADEESDPKNFIQQLSGKLAQSLRDYNSQNETDLDLEKFAVNSVISATHTGKMDPKEQGDIIEKIKTAGTDEYVTKDEEEGEDDDELDMDIDMDVDPTGAMPTNPASEAPPAGGMGESFDHTLDLAGSYTHPQEGTLEAIRGLAKQFYNDGNNKLGKELNLYAFMCDTKGMTPDNETINQIIYNNGESKVVDLGETFQRKEVFADPKLGVPDEESNFYPLGKKKNEGLGDEDFERLQRSVEYGIDPELGSDDYETSGGEEMDDFEKLERSVEYGIDPEVGSDDYEYEGDIDEVNNDKNLDISYKKDSFVDNTDDADFSISSMIQDYLNKHNGFQEEYMNEPTIKPETKPSTEPTTKPRPSRRHSPYRIEEQPGVNPNPKAKK